MLRKGTMGLAISTLAAVICYAATVCAAPPSAIPPYLVSLKTISQANNYTVLFPNVTSGYADTRIPI